MKPEEFKEWNEQMVKKYDPDSFHHHHNPFIRFIESKRVRSIFKMMDIHKDDFVVEIGCGAGNVIEKVVSGKLFGTDISPSILLKAKEKLNQKVQLFQADAEILPCKDQVFMQVICSEVLEHLLDPSAALNEIARILKKEGTAIISIPNESMINRIKSILIRLGIFKWLFQKKGDYQEMPERMEDEWHLHTFKLKEWFVLFDKLFKVTRVKKIPFSCLPLRYVVRLEKIV
ncbi:MAG: methyltransferase domain-containing protein [Thermodesulfobacteriota bacterium]|nr:methyltransferase domain-containing protein [Thermodesulfobacteriota bacterium]